MVDLMMCRICAKQQSRDLRLLFDGTQTKILKQIEKLTGKWLKNDMSLPHHICQACLVDLRQAFDFRVRLLTVQYYFTTANYQKKIKVALQKFKNKQVNLQHQENHEQQSNESIESMAFIEEHLEDDNDYTNIGHYEISFKDTTQNTQNDRLVTEALLEEAQFDDELYYKDFNDDFIELPECKRDDYNTAKFVCDQCGQGFKNSSHLVVHMRRHTGERPFKCKFCTKNYITISDLIRHTRRHTGERPFPCRYCGKRFVDYTVRFKHERTHRNIRKHECMHCNKTFTEKYNLKKHLVIHTGERPYHCTVCNRSFRYQTTHLKHFTTLIHQQNEEKLRNTKSVTIDVVESS